MLLVQPNAHIVGVPLLARVAQRRVEVDHLVIAVEGDLASSLSIFQMLSFIFTL